MISKDRLDAMTEEERFRYAQYRLGYIEGDMAQHKQFTREGGLIWHLFNFVENWARDVRERRNQEGRDV